MSLNYPKVPLLGKKFVPYNPRPVAPLGIPSPLVHVETNRIPVKWIHGMETGERLQHGDLRFEGTGRVCGECANMYYDASLRWDRCRAKGWKRVHREWSVDFMPKSWTDPMTGYDVPAGFDRCPYFVSRERYARR